VAAGGNDRVNIKLELKQRVEVVKPKPVATPRTEVQPTQEQPRSAHPGRPAKFAAIGLVAGAVVAGAVAIYTWRSYIKLQDEAHADLQSIAATPGSNPDPTFFGSPRCDNVPIAPGPMRDSYTSHCESGNRYANATTGLWVSAGALAAAGIISFIVGERMDANAEKRMKNIKGIKESLRLVPALSTTGGGLQASFEF
jgi:hypothetical protein